MELKLQIRWLIERDLAEVMRIENTSFGFPWTEDDLRLARRRTDCVGMVAELDRKILGFMVYRLHKRKLRILNFAVAPEHRRQGTGSAMACRLIGKLSQKHRRKIVLKVRETNLAAQLFFRSNGFRAVRVRHNYYEDTGEDAYTMHYRLPSEKDCWPQHKLTNRISEHLSP